MKRNNEGMRKFKASVVGGVTLIVLLSLAVSAEAQPIVDSVKALQKINDKSYRFLAALDNFGESYTFTNVIKWHIVDAELNSQLRDVLQKEPFNLDPKTYRIDDIYLFSAPIAGSDQVEPFHILVEGENIEKKKKATLGSPFGGDEDSGGPKSKKTFQGKMVIHYLHTHPAVLENINSIQGENVEIPGEIVPHGSQLVKDVRMRYLFAKMFTQFYSKRAVIDEQRRYYGLPTTESLMELQPADAGADTILSPIDPEQTQALPEDQLSEARAARYDKLIDLSINHLWVNASKNLNIELETGNAEVGLPFWTSGEGRLWLNLKNMIGSQSSVKLGVAFPLDIGDSQFLVFSPRKLSGFYGASMDAYFAGIDFFSAFNLPLAFKFSYMPTQSSNGSIIPAGGNKDSVVAKAMDGSDVNVPLNKVFYRTSLIAQLYVPTIMQLDLNNFIQISVGVGIHNVQESIIPGATYTDDRNGRHPLAPKDKADNVVDLVRVSNPVSPHLAVEYVNHRNSKFGLSIAYDHLFSFGGWIELLQDHLRLELGFTTPLIRDPKPWEPDNFFSITPRIYF
jgi:hypothetical protein